MHSSSFKYLLKKRFSKSLAFVPFLKVRLKIKVNKGEAHNSVQIAAGKESIRRSKRKLGRSFPVKARDFGRFAAPVIQSGGRHVYASNNQQGVA